MIDVEITIGPYIIRPEGNRPDGRVFIKIMRADDADAYGHPFGQERVVDVDSLFHDTEAK